MIDALIGFLQEQHPVIILAVLTLLLIACGIGSPIPEDALVIIAGYAAYHGSLHPGFGGAEVNWSIAVAGVIPGVLGGDFLTFMIGRRYGERVFYLRLVRKFADPEKVEKAKHYFDRWGNRAILLARFTPGFRFVVFLTAGMMGIGPRRFVMVDGLGACISAPFFVSIGYYFGPQIDKGFQYARKIQTGLGWVVVALVAMLVVRAIFVTWMKKQEQP